MRLVSANSEYRIGARAQSQAIGNRQEAIVNTEKGQRHGGGNRQ